MDKDKCEVYRLIDPSENVFFDNAYAVILPVFNRKVYNKKMLCGIVVLEKKDGTMDAKYVYIDTYMISNPYLYEKIGEIDISKIICEGIKNLEKNRSE